MCKTAVHEFTNQYSQNCIFFKIKKKLMLKKPVSEYKLTRSYVRGVLSLYPTWPARPHGEHASLSYSSRSHNVVVTFLLPFCGLFPDLLAWSTEAIKFNFKKEDG